MAYIFKKINMLKYKETFSFQINEGVPHITKTKETWQQNTTQDLRFSFTIKDI